MSQVLKDKISVLNSIIEEATAKIKGLQLQTFGREEDWKPILARIRQLELIRTDAEIQKLRLMLQDQ